MNLAISVFQLIQYIKRQLDGDTNLNGVMLKGEISNFTHHRSGHCYFTLKDDKAKIACVMFATHAKKLNIKVENGMQVLVRGNVSMFETSGQIQLYVESLELDGIGALFLRLEELKMLLKKEGLFDPAHKKPLVKFPKTIAVISAKEGAATQDVFTTLKRRWPVAQILFFPALVQGREATNDLIRALRHADSLHPDVILLVRGGGSIEDLWCFNEEPLLRAVYATSSVVVSGVGHETDTTLVDYISDFRAPTPTAAAEFATPNIEDVLVALHQLKQRLQQRMQQQFRLQERQYMALANHPFLKNPRYVWQQKQQQFDQLETSLMEFISRYERSKHSYVALKHRFLNSSQALVKEQKQLDLLSWQLQQQIKQTVARKEQQLLVSITKLEAYSPLQAIKKGYVLSYQDNVLLRSMEQVRIDGELQIQFSDGNVFATATRKEPHHESE